MPIRCAAVCAAALAGMLLAPDAFAQTPALSFDDNVQATDPATSSSTTPTPRSSYDGGITVDRYSFFVRAESQVRIDVRSYEVFARSFDPHVRLYRDDGQPLSSANRVANANNNGLPDLNGSTDDRDPFLDIVLPAGGYVVAIGVANMSDAEAEAGFSNGTLIADPGVATPVGRARYQLDIFGDEVFPSPPATITNLSTDEQFDSLQDAINDAGIGDVIELSEGTVFESNVNLLSKNITLRGQGPTQTELDARGEGPGFRAGVGRATIEGLTIRNTVAAVSNTGAALRLDDIAQTVVFRDVHFVSNDSGGSAFSTIAAQPGNVLIDRCVFRDNTTRDTETRAHIGITDGGTLRMTNAVFFDNNDAEEVLRIEGGDSSAFLANATFADNDAQRVVLSISGASTVVFNSVAEGPMFAGSANGSSNVFPGAGSNNTNAMPVFVDASNDDYRLAPTSPGIDAGDFERYITAGGGPLDAAGIARFFDDPATDNGPLTGAAIDAGAFELEATPTASCPADQNGDGVVTGVDFTDFIANFGAGCP